MIKEEIIKILSEFPLFHELNNHEIGEIASISITREWNKGSHVFFQDEPIENVYFIFEGKVKIYKTDMEGKEQIVSLLKKGDMFPHVGFFRKGGYPAFSEILENSILIVVPIAQFEVVLIEHPDLCIKVLKVLGEKIIDFQERLESQILNNTYQQIMKLIIRLGKEHGQVLPDGSIILKSEFTNRDLARMIGTTRETVSRMLTKLKKEHRIKTDANHNLIFDPDLLEEYIYS